ncbi:exported hypothetical protein [Planktothrix sp. PCC 11201]|uniref:hypothetical protein n=1 Tax=Planktothrix sp. PCC 11201 TaxID=1729650 RepID=UPI0009228AD6|nr:hypothetical protein [Planktothrix sp. PCC 11201]SKB15433.1 exported hypothetical protein [Planktothrix sp. PCC 11201]
MFKVFKRFCLTIVLVGFLLLTTGTFSVSAQNVDIQIKDVPPQVLLSAKRVLPDAKWTIANWDLGDNGLPVIEIEGTLNGKKVEVDVYTDGGIEEVERDISESEVPPVVMTALKKYVPTFQIAAVNKSETSGVVDRYEFRDSNGLSVKIGEFGQRVLITSEDAGR